MVGNEKELTHIDLFSGIGGFTLAAEWAGFRTIAFCEKETFCQKILKKRFGAVVADSEYLRKLQSERSKQDIRKRPGNIPIIPEIRDVDGTKYRGATLLTGGFPCQPFSVAGQRRGKEDDRYLWPQMRRVISEARPHWILAENVPGIFHMALDTVLADLEREGYATGTFIIPACGLNAPHRRNRVWIVANAKINNAEQFKTRNTGQEGKVISGDGIRLWNKLSGSNSPASNASSERLSKPQKSKLKQSIFHAQRNNPETNQHPDNINAQRPGEQRNSKESIGLHGRENSLWQEDWHEVATRFCRVDDGIPDRVHRLKALGNAIVPQVAYEILKNIAWIEKHRST